MKEQKTKSKLEIIEDFCKHVCIVCGKRICIPCGVPIVSIGGCCSGVTDDDEKVQYIRPVRAHFGCYLDAIGPQKKLINNEIKTRWKYYEVEEHMEKLEEIESKRRGEHG